MTLEELKAMYGEKGAMEQRVTQTEQGDQIDYIPVQLGEGWTAYENQPQIIGYEGQGMDATPIYGVIDPEDKLGGFQRSEGNKNYFYDTNGKLVHVEKQTTDWDTLGPIIMGAATMGGGAGLLGSTLFPSLSGAAAAGAGGALLGGANAALTDQNILKGALLGGAGSAGALELGDTGLKLGDAVKALKFAENPTIAGAAGLASPYVGNVDLGDTGVSLNDIMKGVGTAQALSSGNPMTIMKTIAGLANNQGNLKSSLAGFEANPEDFIEGYFQPGGEGYLDSTSQDMTVREDPENLDALLRALAPYGVDGGTSIFAQGDDVPELETVSNRPITSIESILGNPDILQTVEADVPEMLITGDRPVSELNSLRTKGIVSDIPDEITQDQIDKLNLDTKIEDILQTVAPPGTKIPTPTKTATPTGTKTTDQLLANLGLGGMQMSSQDPYADIKLMEEVFGPDIAYKLMSLGGNKRK